jgi:hypothetical protein
MTTIENDTKQKERADNSTLDAALEYAEAGIPVFPCKRTKGPLTPNGFKDATTDPKQIRNWWAKWPHAMIGMPTGLASGVDVLDIDVKPDEHVDGHKFVPGFAKLSPVQVQTPSGGTHLYFRSKGKVRISRCACNAEPKISDLDFVQ